jgi:hypothetical protein
MGYLVPMTDLERARDALAAASLPDWVERLNAEGMVDHTGDPALRVTVVIRDDREQVVEDGPALSGLTRQVLSVLQAVGVELFPYLRFVTAAEVA